MNNFCSNLWHCKYENYDLTSLVQIYSKIGCNHIIER